MKVNKPNRSFTLSPIKLLFVFMFFIFPVFASEIGFEFLDNDSVWHIWNENDNYYFNATSGVQFTNHYDDYWTHNVFCAGYNVAGNWNYVCNDVLPFTWSYDTDNATYVNITGWRNWNVGSYYARIVLRYHLGLTDRKLTVIPYIENTGTLSIPYDLGFAWRLNDIKISSDEPNDQILINRTKYDLNETLDLTFTNMTTVTTWSDIDEVTNETIGNYTNVEYHPYYEISDTSTNQYLRVDWNENLTYFVKIESNAEYNSPVLLGINAGKLAVGQSKQTEILWIDADTFYSYPSSVSTGTRLTSNSYANDATYDSDTIELYLDSTEYVTTFSTTSGTITGVEVCYDLYVTGTRADDTLWLKYHPAGSSETTLETVTTNVNYDDDNGGTHKCFDRFGDLSWTWSDVASTWIEIDGGQSKGPDVWTVNVDWLYLKITYTPVSTNDEPLWFIPSINGTGFNISDTVEHRTYWTDDTALSFAYLEINSTGVGCDTTANISEMVLSGTGNWSNMTWNVPTLCEGKTIGWRIYVNDSDGEWNVTDLQSYDILTDNPPKWFAPSINGTGFNISDTVEHRTYWTDDWELEYAYLEVNSTGAGCDVTSNISGTSLAGLESWSNLTWDIPVACEGLTIGWKIYANDSNGEWNVTDLQTYDIIQDDPPQWSNVSINGTGFNISDTVEHRAYWLDDWELSYAILEVNGTGASCDVSANVSETGLSGTADWSNMTWDIPVICEGLTIGWRIYANDSKGEWNVTNLEAYQITQDNPPKWYVPSINGTGFNISDTVEYRTYWEDDFELGYAYLEINSTGVGCDTVANISGMGLSGSSGWSNLTWDIPNLCEGKTIGWRMWANDSNGEWNVTDLQVYDIIQNDPPQYSLLSTNDSTVFNSDVVEHRGYWTDEFELSFAYLEVNGTGASCDTWDNISQIELSGVSDWSNITWSVPSECVGKTVGWRLWANDSIGQWNMTTTNAYSVSGYGWLNISWLGTSELGTSCTSGTPCEFNVSDTFFVKSQIQCNGGDGYICGDVNASFRYNMSANPDTIVSMTEYETPFYIVDGAESQVIAETILMEADAEFFAFQINETHGIAHRAGEYNTISLDGTSNSTAFYTSISNYLCDSVLLVDNAILSLYAGFGADDNFTITGRYTNNNTLFLEQTPLHSSFVLHALPEMEASTISVFNDSTIIAVLYDYTTEISEIGIFNFTGHNTTPLQVVAEGYPFKIVKMVNINESSFLYVDGAGNVTVFDTSLNVLKHSVVTTGEVPFIKKWNETHFANMDVDYPNTILRFIDYNGNVGPVTVTVYNKFPFDFFKLTEDSVVFYLALSEAGWPHIIHSTYLNETPIYESQEFGMSSNRWINADPAGWLANNNKSLTFVYSEDEGYGTAEFGIISVYHIPTFKNPQSFGSFASGTTQYINYTINATQAGTYLLDFRTWSNTTEVLENSTFDAFVYILSPEGIMDYFKEFTATLYLSDQSSKTVTYFRTFTSNLDLSDLFSRAGIYLRTFTSNLDLSDSASKAGAYFRTFTPNIDLSDSISRKGAYLRVFSGDLTLDSQAFRKLSYWREFTGSVVLDSTFDRAANYFRLFSGDITLATIISYPSEVLMEYFEAFIADLSVAAQSSKTVAYFRTFTSNLDLSDSFSRAAEYLRAFSGDLVIDSQATRTASFWRSFTNTLTLDSAISRQAEYFRLFTQDLSLSADAIKRTGFFRAFTGDLAIDSQMMRQISFFRSITGDLSLDSQGFRQLAFFRAITGDISLDSQMNRQLSFFRAFVGDLSIDSQMARRLSLFRSFTGNMDLTASISSSAFFEIAEYFKSFVADLSISAESSKLVSYFRDFSNNIDVTGSISKTASYLRAFSGGLIVDSQAHHNTAFFRSFSSNLLLDSSISRHAEYYRLFLQDISLSANAIKQTNFFRSVIGDLSLDSQVIRRLSLFRSFTGNMDLTASISSSAFFEIAEYFKAFIADISLAAESSKTAAYFRDFSNNIDLTGSVSRGVSYLRTFTSDLALDSTISRQANYFRLFTQDLSMSAEAIKQTTFFRAFADSLSLSGDAARKMSFLRYVSAPLSITATTTKQAEFFRTVTGSLTLFADVTRQNAFFRYATGPLDLDATTVKQSAFYRTVTGGLILFAETDIYTTATLISQYFESFVAALILDNSITRQVSYLREFLAPIVVTASTIPATIIEIFITVTKIIFVQLNSEYMAIVALLSGAVGLFIGGEIRSKKKRDQV